MKRCKGEGSLSSCKHTHTHRNLKKAATSSSSSLLKKGVHKISAEEKAVEKYTSGADDEYKQGFEDLKKIELTH